MIKPMNNRKTKKPIYKSMSGKVIYISIGIAIFFWAFEALLHALVFKLGSFKDMLFPDEPNELWMRIIIIFLL